MTDGTKCVGRLYPVHRAPGCSLWGMQDHSAQFVQAETRAIIQHCPHQTGDKISLLHFLFAYKHLISPHNPQHAGIAPLHYFSPLDPHPHHTSIPRMWWHPSALLLFAIRLSSYAHCFFLSAALEGSESLACIAAYLTIIYARIPTDMCLTTFVCEQQTLLNQVDFEGCGTAFQTSHRKVILSLCPMLTSVSPSFLHGVAFAWVSLSKVRDRPDEYLAWFPGILLTYALCSLPGCAIISSPSFLPTFSMSSVAYA